MHSAITRHAWFAIQYCIADGKLPAGGRLSAEDYSILRRMRSLAIGTTMEANCLTRNECIPPYGTNQSSERST